jgi:hypothetical protein
MRRSWLKQITGRTILLHLKDADSVEGILIGEFSDGVTLRHAKMLKPGSPQATEMDGEVFVPRDQVVLAQRGR